MTTFLLACLATASLPVDGWMKYAPERGGFSVMLPSKPTESKQQAVETEVDFAEAIVEHGQCRYLATFSHVQRKILDFMPSGLVVHFTIKTFLNSESSRVVQESRTRMGKTFIRHLLIENQDENKERWTRMSIGLIDQNMVIVQVSSTTRAAVESKDANRFFDSFMLTNVANSPSK